MNCTKILVLFILLSFTNSALWAQTIFETRSPQTLIKQSLELVDELALDENKKDPTLAEKRFVQYLILSNKKAESEINIDYLQTYLSSTEACLKSPGKCFVKMKAENNDHLGSFYTYFQKEDIADLKASLNELSKDDDLDFQRAKIVNLSFNALKLGVQESDGPNDDSVDGPNYIAQYFKGAGVSYPKREMDSNKVDGWAWCAAFVTAIVNQAGGGFSFLTFQEYFNSCRELDKQSHCHPIQVDFILNWAKKKAQVEAVDSQSISSLKAGDILVLLHPKKKNPSHIGFYVGKTKACSVNIDDDLPQKDSSNVTLDGKCWIYTIEGNAGPFINDQLENDWPIVKKQLNTEAISLFDYERLLDRATIVRRPLSSWDYSIKLN